MRRCPIRRVKAAFELAQRDGAAGLTMRRLGVELKVDATIPYRLFRDKDELLLAVYDHATRPSVEWSSLILATFARSDLSREATAIDDLVVESVPAAAERESVESA